MRGSTLLVALLLLCPPLFSQIIVQKYPPLAHVATPAACGDMRARVLVDLDETQHSILPPEPGKARIVFVFDYGDAIEWSYPFLRVGIGGQWVGGLAKNSWFSTTVEPGEQHICVAAKDDVVWLAHLTVEAGKTYYYRMRGGPEPVDSDEAAYLIAQFPMTKIHVKK
jgi:hypothetical protein